MQIFFEQWSLIRARKNNVMKTSFKQGKKSHLLLIKDELKLRCSSSLILAFLSELSKTLKLILNIKKNNFHIELVSLKRPNERTPDKIERTSDKIQLQYKNEHKDYIYDVQSFNLYKSKNWKVCFLYYLKNLFACWAHFLNFQQTLGNERQSNTTFKTVFYSGPLHSRKVILIKLMLEHEKNLKLIKTWKLYQIENKNSR